MGTPIAYFLTWTTRGAWLHGDRRGSVDREHNGWRRPVLSEDVWREAAERDQTEGAVTLSARARAMAGETIERVCSIRGWRLHAQDVRTQHLHAVVAAPGCPPERVMQQLKSWISRDLRAAGLVPGQGSLWTRHGSTRYIWRDDQLASAVSYVLNEQDNRRRYERGRPGPEPRA